MIKGKAAVITGSTSGIGLGIAAKLAAAGASIMLNGFSDAATIENIQRDLAKSGVKVDYHGADVTKPDQVADLITTAQKQFGRVDILVNNAGIQHVSPIDLFPLDRWQAVLDTNLSSVFYGIRAVLPAMRQQRSGRIINIASVHGLVASVNKSAYVAAKHGTVGLTKVTALETAGSGITCNAICPGWVHTPLVQKQIDAIATKEAVNNDEATIKLLSEKQPSKQFVSIEQIGDLVLFLASDAAAQVTGAAWTIDGGWTAV